jgi:hypothetical protein
LSRRSAFNRWACGLAFLLVLALPDAAVGQGGGILSRATLVSPGALVQGQLSRDTPDTYAFHATAGQRFVLELTGDEILVELRAPNGATKLALPQALRHFAVLPAKTGLHFLRLEWHPWNPGSGQYQFLLREVADPQGETPATAADLALGEDAAAGSDFPDDVDVFRLAAIPGKRLLVSLRDVPAELRITIEVRDGSRLLSRHRTSGGDFSFPVLPETPLFLDLRTPYEPQGRRYRVQVEETGDDHPESPAGAVALEPGGPALASTLGLEDRDVFAIDALAGQLFLIKVNSSPVFPRQSFFADLLGPDGQVIEKQLSSFLVLRAERDGRHFLSIRSRFQQAASLGYDIALSAPIQEDHGDVAALATPVAVDGAGVPGLWEHPDDVDFFSFAAAAGETLEIEAAGSEADSDPLLTLLDATGATLAEDDDSGGPWKARLAFTFPVAGTYFTRVDPSVGSYVLTVRRLP